MSFRGAKRREIPKTTVCKTSFQGFLAPSSLEMTFRRSTAQVLFIPERGDKRDYQKFMVGIVSNQMIMLPKKYESIDNATNLCYYLCNLFYIFT
jgi:hypothetical protein